MGDCLGDPPQNWYRNATTGQPINTGAIVPPTSGTPAKAANGTSKGGASPTAVSGTSFGTGSSGKSGAGSMNASIDRYNFTSLVSALFVILFGLARFI
jgi:hypothetical protein